jgi:hypothetical protein
MALGCGKKHAEALGAEAALYIGEVYAARRSQAAHDGFFVELVVGEDLESGGLWPCVFVEGLLVGTAPAA